jgi:RNA methyltransferase, TrmH family
MISSVHNESIIQLSKLHTKKYRILAKQALVDGEHLVDEAYQAQVLHHVYGLSEVPRYHDIGYTQVSEAVMRKLCNTSSLSKMVGVITIREPKPLDTTVLVLDGVQDPGNVGTLLRSALAFNFSSVITLPGCADVYSAKVMAASQGAIFKCELHDLSYDEFKQVCNELKYHVVVSDVHEATSLEAFSFKTPGMLVLGSEGAGVSSFVRALAHERVKIETVHVESLNVAMAGSILMYALFSRKG